MDGVIGAQKENIRKMILSFGKPDLMTFTEFTVLT